MKWTRPASVPFPSVWGHYTGKRPMANGKIPEFRIQDAPEEMYDEIVEHMRTVFLKDEPISANCKVVEDPVSLEEVTQIWKSVLKQRLAIVALEVAEDGTTKMAGVNVTALSEEDKDLQLKGEKSQKIMGLLSIMAQKGDIFKRYGVTEYMTALGLSVQPEYRGQGLGLEILKARVPLCKAVGLKLTGTVFTAGNSQELARRAGFELLYETAYADYKVNGEEVFPGLPVKMCQTMALKIE